MRPISSLESRSRRFIITGSVLVALATGFAILQAYAGAGIPRNTRVGGVDVGGLSSDAAKLRLSDAFVHSASNPFRVQIADRTYEMPVVNRAVQVDVPATVSHLLASRWNPVALVGMLRGDAQEPVMTVDRSALERAVSLLSSHTAIPAVDAAIDMVTEPPSVVAAKSGLGLDVPVAVQGIIDAVLRGDATLRVRRVERPALISTMVAELALANTALPAIAESVTVILAMEDGTQRTSVIAPQTIRDALTFVPSGSLLEPRLDGLVLRRDVDTALMDAQVFAKRAKFRIAGTSISVVPSIDGYGISASSIANDVLRVIGERGSARVVTLQMGPITPAFTTADAESLGITELVASYTQKFPPAAYRTQNIGTAARYIQGTILRPGDTFSMNDTVKERTVENGYTEGWIIGPDGVFRMEQGGAVSTITTAMFNAAWFAGLKLVEHRAHSIYISRYPAGREATVSWGSFDMKFRNTLSHAILITTKLRRDSIAVSFWGTKEWEDIGSEFGPWTEQKPYPEIESADPVCHDQDGMPGFHITVWRTFFRDGLEVKREPYRTSYRPSPHVICLANAKPSAKPSPTRTPSPTPVATSPAPTPPSTSATPSPSPTTT